MACTFHFYINSKLQQDTIIFYNKPEKSCFPKKKKKKKKKKRFLWAQLDAGFTQLKKGIKSRVLHDQQFA